MVQGRHTCTFLRTTSFESNCIVLKCALCQGYKRRMWCPYVSRSSTVNGYFLTSLAVQHPVAQLAARKQTPVSAYCKLLPEVCIAAVVKLLLVSLVTIGCRYVQGAGACH